MAEALKSYVHDHHLIGTGSTLLAFSLPDGLLNGVGKVILAIATSVAASYISAKIKAWSEKKGK